MAWVYANTGEDYVGETHTLAGTVYSGATRTPSSRRLIEVPDAPKKEPAPKKAAAKGKSK